MDFWTHPAAIPRLLSAFGLLFATSVMAAEAPSYQVLAKAALQQSLESKRAVLLQNIARAQEEVIGYGGWPSLGVAAAVTGQRDGPTSASSEIEAARSLRLRLSYDLYDFDKTAARNAAAAHATEIQALNVAEINETLLWQVARAYLNVLAAQDLVTISRENLEISEDKLGKIRGDFRRGLRPEIDLVAAEADLGSAQLSFERAKTELVVTTGTLHALTGVRVDTEALTAPQFAPLKRTPNEWEPLIREWNDLLPSVAEQRRRIEKESLAAARAAVTAEALPNLALELEAAREYPRETAARETYSGQLALTWDLTWPGQFRAARQELAFKNEAIAAEAAIEDRDRSHALQLAKDRFAASRRLWETMEKQLTLRQRQHKLTRARYNAGKATPLELSNSELELGNTRLERARIGLAVATAVLDMAEARRIKDPAVMFR